jgi:hypothetical protein
MFTNIIILTKDCGISFVQRGGNARLRNGATSESSGFSAHGAERKFVMQPFLTLLAVPLAVVGLAAAAWSAGPGNGTGPASSSTVTTPAQDGTTCPVCGGQCRGPNGCGNGNGGQCPNAGGNGMGMGWGRQGLRGPGMGAGMGQGAGRMGMGRGMGRGRGWMGGAGMANGT